MAYGDEGAIAARASAHHAAGAIVSPVDATTWEQAMVALAIPEGTASGEAAPHPRKSDLTRLRSTMFVYLPHRSQEALGEHLRLIELLECGGKDEVEAYARWHKLHTVEAYRAMRATTGHATTGHATTGHATTGHVTTGHVTGGKDRSAHP